ncbi:NAD(P)-dependent oxidoreductase [Denitratisoma oestradiolicum]|uniref:D-isomer specific 2-hydroxyacid dehydrogenase NAD-binding domain-containing protein n=1 Tax=Denitratisoma oestradiolicum TaxID=311182 RepID=A0A6S6XVR6_9PROT|nr:NAD(P)-dependent oxidoreductase [Denitratisoma oestradiolicum]TWO80105.1 hypothetical protein CBW56_11070 [Denitratisoma oestradiolicum]CAB1370059.1 conserved protein of unknown function [Denitratisoma oestradiolicum]
MRLALNFQAPATEEALLRHTHGMELIKVPAQGALAGEVDVLLTPLVGTQPLAELLPKCQGLQWVHIFGTGADTFPFGLAGDIKVSCSRGASATAIAEWVLAMMLSFEKRLPQSWVSAPPAQWFLADLGGLEGKTLGLLGFGAIGQAIARRALAFDMKVVAKVRQHRPSPMVGVTLVDSLEQVLGAADHLVLALSATAASRGLLGAEQLAMTQPGVHLVNVARSGLIDQDALRPLLDRGHIAMASLDVVEPEPLPAGHWLYAHPRVRLSPHISWSAPGMVDRMLAIFLRNLEAFAQGRPLEGLVDVAAGY